MVQNKWTVENIPDQAGRIVIVTGASSGIGFETARILSDKNAGVIMAVRNSQKGKNARQKIKDQNPKANVSVMLLDLANLKSIKHFADEFKEKFNRLDILINNAGVMIPPYSKTEDGFELQFGTNHLGHFALTLQLLNLLEQTEYSRIVNVSSNAHNAGNINFDDLTWAKRPYNKIKAYGDSKIANLYFTYELQNKLAAKRSKIKVLAAHPGWTATNLQRHNKFVEFLNNFFAMPIEQGALPTLRAATDEQAQGGEYYGPDGWKEWRGYPVKVNSNELSHNADNAKKLWDISELLTGANFDE